MLPLKGPHDPWVHRVDSLRKYLSEVPDDSSALALLAAGLNFQGEHAESLQLAKRAVEADPSNAFAHYILARALVGPRLNAKQRVAEAIASATRAIALDPDNPSFYVQLAYLHFLRGCRSWRRRPFLLALEAAEAGLRIDPDSATCEYFRGLTLRHLSRHTEAEAAFHRAVSLDPSSALYRAAYAHCLFNLLKLDAAIAQWTEAARLEPASRRNCVRLRVALGLKRLVEFPINVAPRLGLVFYPRRSGGGSLDPQPAKMNWRAGLVLALTIVGSEEFVGTSVGEHPGWHSAVAGCLVGVTGVIFSLSAGRIRTISGTLMAFCAIGWLEGSTLELLSPSHISAATRAAWPHLHPGPIFQLARIAGVAAIAAMAIFLGAFATIRLQKQGRAH